MQKKKFKYFAIRVMDFVIFRRTVVGIKKVKSVLYKPGSMFRLEQVTYTGGQSVGCMPYKAWISYGGSAIRVNGILPISREQFKSLDPYIQKERKVT